MWSQTHAQINGVICLHKHKKSHTHMHTYAVTHTFTCSHHSHDTHTLIYLAAQNPACCLYHSQTCFSCGCCVRCSVRWILPLQHCPRCLTPRPFEAPARLLLLWLRGRVDAQSWVSSSVGRHVCAHVRVGRCEPRARSAGFISPRSTGCTVLLHP